MLYLWKCKGLSWPKEQEAWLIFLIELKKPGTLQNTMYLILLIMECPKTEFRIYIIGFKDKQLADSFQLPKPIEQKVKLEIY